MLGVIADLSLQVKPFTNKQIELVETFADQAVIAIENVRLFDEVQARTRELAQSVEELQALGEVTQAVNSTLDLQIVLDTIVAKATQLSNTEAGAIYVFDEVSRGISATRDLRHGRYHHRRDQGSSYPSWRDSNRQGLWSSASRSRFRTFRMIRRRFSTLSCAPGFRALLTVPLLGADRIVGALVVRRKEPGEFSKNTVDLLQTFAAQSVLAIQNARLFHEIEEKGRELARQASTSRSSSPI